MRFPTIQDAMDYIRNNPAIDGTLNVIVLGGDGCDCSVCAAESDRKDSFNRSGSVFASTPQPPFTPASESLGEKVRLDVGGDRALTPTEHIEKLDKVIAGLRDLLQRRDGEIEKLRDLILQRNTEINDLHKEASTRNTRNFFMAETLDDIQRLLKQPKPA